MKTIYIKPTTEVVFPVTEEFMLSATVNKQNGDTDSYVPSATTTQTENLNPNSQDAKHFNAWETWD